MKLLLCALSFLGLFTANAEELELFVLAGQSNMAGRGKVEDADKIPDPQVLALNKKMKWVEAVDPVHFDRDFAGVGPGRTFGICIAKKLTDKKVGLIPCAVGGTSIQKWQKGDNLYRNLIKRAKFAQKNGTLRAILWIQGEGDASDKEKAEQQYELLRKLIADIREELNMPNLIFIIGEVPPLKREAIDILHKTQQKVATDTPNCYYVKMPADAEFHSDELHINAQTARKMGENFAKTYLEIIKN